MIVRTCDAKKNKKVNSLLTAALASERFQLASKWFHCVRIEEEDIGQSHYRELFAGRKPAHMVLATWDGKTRINLLGSVSQKVSWPKVSSVLKKAYKKDPTRAVKTLEKLLNTFDALDKRESELSAQLTRCEEKKKAGQIKKVKKQLEKLAKERETALATEKKASELQLRRDPLATEDD